MPTKLAARAAHSTIIEQTPPPAETLGRKLPSEDASGDASETSTSLGGAEPPPGGGVVGRRRPPRAQQRRRPPRRAGHNGRSMQERMVPAGARTDGVYLRQLSSLSERRYPDFSGGARRRFRNKYRSAASGLSDGSEPLPDEDTLGFSSCPMSMSMSISMSWDSS